jgi:hypothetical protein
MIEFTKYHLSPHETSVIPIDFITKGIKPKNLAIDIDSVIQFTDSDYIHIPMLNITHWLKVEELKCELYLKTKLNYKYYNQAIILYDESRIGLCIIGCSKTKGFIANKKL